MEEESRRRSLPGTPDCSQSSKSSKSSKSSRRKQQSRGDQVIRATMQQLQQLGVDVDGGDLTDSDRKLHQAVESSRYGAHLLSPEGCIRLQVMALL